MKILRFFVMSITIQDFSGIYKEQTFMQKLRENAICQEKKLTRNNPQQNIHWLDCTQITGTDCYCDDEAITGINKLIDENRCSNCRVDSTTTPDIHFFDNGNYHYMSKIWTDRVQEPFDLVVFDHHPDMQPPRFGDILSCGGWVKKVLEENKFVQNTILIGVADHLVEELQEDIASLGDRASSLTIVKESELAYIDERRETRDERTASGLQTIDDREKVDNRKLEVDSLNNGASRGIDAESAKSHFIRLEPRTSNLYLSIDKDVLSPADAATNWDQGSLTFEALKKIITELSQGKKILGIDICGERAQEFKPIENGAQTAQEADELNNKLNQELVEFLRCEV